MITKKRHPYFQRCTSVFSSYIAPTHLGVEHCSPRDEPLLIMCLGAKGLRVVSKSEFCADFKK